MQAVVRLGRGLVTVLALVALAGVLFFSLADPGSLLISVPLAVAFGLLLAGRRLESVRLIAAADALAVVAIVLLAFLHLRG